MRTRSRPGGIKTLWCRSTTGFFALLDWRGAPERQARAWLGPAPHPRRAYVKALLVKICEGYHLRTLREIMDEVYRLFDRRCRAVTALAKLARLRQRVQRFTQLRKALQPLFSTNLEKALTFLDDQLLPATSNAVERGNRRYRKMQKTIYRVRTQAHIVGRMALDMLRDAFAQVHRTTLQLLHQARSGPALPFTR